MVGALELLTRRKIFAFSCNALEIIGVILPAMSRLVCVGEAGVKPSGLQDVLAGQITVGHRYGVCNKADGLKTRNAAERNEWLIM